MKIYQKFIVIFFIIFSNLCLADISEHFPLLTGRVMDNANILSQDTKNNLQNILTLHEQNTTNQIVVLTLNSLHGYPIEEFGYKLGRYWSIGQKGKDNGVLLLVAPNERKVRIEVGYGLEGALTDAIASDIVQHSILSEFKKGDYDSGVLNGVENIIQAIQGEYSSHEDEEFINLAFLWGCVAMFIILNIIATDLRNEFLERIAMAFGMVVVVGGIPFLLVSYMLPYYVLLLFLPIGFYASTGHEFFSDEDELGYDSSYGGDYSGGDGFSGGGGSFGGGGASGSW